jgi:hypothetical protein
MDFQEIVDAGEPLLVMQRLQTCGESSGAPIPITHANAFTVRSGLITRYVVHEDRVQAPEALGRREWSTGEVRRERGGCGRSRAHERSGPGRLRRYPTASAGTRRTDPGAPYQEDAP